jgi:hypothetical protein
MTFDTVQFSDLQIAACSPWVNPAGATELPVPFVLPFFLAVGAGAILSDVELGTPAEYDFVVKVISSTGITPATFVQVQWPDGRYLSNPGVDFFSFVGTGKRGRLIDPHKRVRPQQKIRFNIDNSAGAAASLEIYLEGTLQVPLVGSSS